MPHKVGPSVTLPKPSIAAKLYAIFALMATHDPGAGHRRHAGRSAACCFGG